MRGLIVFVLAVLLGLSGRVFAEQSPLTPEKIEAIDALVEQRMEALKIPGVAIALIDDGRIVHAKGFGITERLGQPITADTPFQLGSVSKSFTALVVMQLVEEGLIELDDPVVKHLRSFQTDTPIVSDTVTIHHLLSHRSGLSTFDGNRNHYGGRDDERALIEAVQSLTGLHLKHTPGDVYEYSNANYQVLGALIEKVTDQPYEVAVTERILQSERMPNSFVYGADVPGVAPAIGHRYWIGRPAVFRGKTGRAVIPQGGIYASANDLAAYLLTYMQPSAGYVSEAGLEDIMKLSDPVGEFDYGLGWMLSDMEDYRLVSHTGLNPGYQTIAGFSPDAGFGFVVLANTSSSFASKDVGALLFGVRNLVMDLPVPEVGPGLGPSSFLWLMYLTPFGIGLEIFLFLRRYRKGILPEGDRGFLNWSFLFRIIVPTLGYLWLATAMLLVVPMLNGAPMSAIRLFNPDLAILLAVVGYTALVWAVVRLVLRLRTWRFIPR